MTTQLPANLAPSIVLDTNVVLDWLVFGNPALAPLIEAIGGARVRWIATDPMRDEMAHVLQRGLGQRWRADETEWRAAWARHATMLAVPVAPLSTPRCTDPDDQKFLELGLSAHARWLITRDRALLKMGRRTSRSGMEIMTPERWPGC